jgi:hypothetical protein
MCAVRISSAPAAPADACNSFQSPLITDGCCANNSIVHVNEWAVVM